MRRCACISVLALAVAGCASPGAAWPVAEEISWHEFSGLAVVHAVTLADGGRVEYAAKDDWFARVKNGPRGALVCCDADGRQRWRIDPPPPPSPPPSDQDLAAAFFASRLSEPVGFAWLQATLVVDAAQLYVVQWISLDDGASVIAVDLATGEWRWGRQVHGYGDIVHSRYSNDVRAKLVRGALVVFGHEDAGDYVEAWSPSGERLWTRLGS